jgi:selenium metabolism protein YedF
MKDHTIDARGLRCPQPLMLTKKALEGMAEGERLQVLIDNELSCENLMRFLNDHKTNPELFSTNGEHTITLTKAAATPVLADAAVYCSAPTPPGGTVVVIHNQGMGSGSEELGKILLQACLNTLKETSPLPAAILCYNAGVFAAAEGAPTVPALEELARQGVSLLICGTCVDYFDLKNKIAVGTISNMYDILLQLSGANRIITL